MALKNQKHKSFLNLDSGIFLDKINTSKKKIWHLLQNVLELNLLVS